VAGEECTKATKTPSPLSSNHKPACEGGGEGDKILEEGERIKKQTRDAAVAKIIAEGHGQET
jgi:hypothetical protein